MEDTQTFKTRQLSDRVERYIQSTEGKCSCGTPVIKTIGSNATNWNDKVRYHYPLDNTPHNIFRCRKCLEPIRETWKEN